jgi:oligo-1,6-glucosidase
MNREVLSKYNIMTVGEGAGVTSDDVLKFVDADRKELNMIYHFEGVSLGYLPGDNNQLDSKGYSLLEFKRVYSKWDSVLAKKGWGTIYLGNHDQPRMVSRWGNDAPAYRELSSKLLTTFLLTMRSTPYYFAGDELGMSNIKFENIDDYRDIATINAYKHLKETGGDVYDFMEYSKKVSRDNARTPFQWNDQTNAGFTDGTPWIKVNPNYKTVNVATEETDLNSCLNYFKKIVQLRRNHKSLIYGKYTLLDPNNPNVYTYTRTLNGKKYLVLLNFSTQQASTNLNLYFKKSVCLIDNYSDNIQIEKGKSISLRPYEAAVVFLQ